MRPDYQERGSVEFTSRGVRGPPSLTQLLQRVMQPLGACAICRRTEASSLVGFRDQVDYLACCNSCTRRASTIEARRAIDAADAEFQEHELASLEAALRRRR